jgi:hypothetical protein
MRLLALGQSLVGVKDQGKRYQLSQQNQLPKFNVSREPVVSGPASAMRFGFLGRIKARFGGRRLGVVSRRMQSAKVGEPLMRATLSLERVRVVRNDLTESDLVIVPVKAGSASGGERKKDVRPKGMRAAVIQAVQRLSDTVRSLV